MRFTKQEVMFMTSVSRGRVPFQVSCPVPEKETKEEYVRETIKTLQQKGILDEKEKLTREGALIIYFWEKYRNSRTHIRMNRINAAVLPGDILIVVIETEDGYEITPMRSEILMLEVLKHAEYLRRKEVKAERSRWQDISREELKDRIEKSDGCIVLSEYLSGRAASEKLYYFKEEKGYLVNLHTDRVRELSPGLMRKQIYRTLQGEG